MKQLRNNIKSFLLIFLSLFVLFTAGVILQSQRARTTLLASSGENRAALAQRYSQAGSILSADGVLLASSDADGKRNYSSDSQLAEAALHVVGDYTHNISYTVESLWQNELLGEGRPLAEQFLLDIQGQGLQGNNIVLSLRSDLMKTAYELLSNRKGAAVVINYKTGAILASVSSPSVHPDQVVAWKDIPDTSLFNRAFLGEYLPGSTFKIITASALLQSNLSTEDTVMCQGSTPLIPGGVNETHINAGHGEVSLQEAMAQSCNHYFGYIGLELGEQKISKAAEQMAFNKTIEFDRFTLSKSQCTIGREDDAALTWAAIGQPAGKDIIQLSPLHLAMISGMIANNGRMTQAYLLESMIYPSGKESTFDNRGDLVAQIDPGLAQQLKDLLRQVVNSGTGVNAQVAGLDVCGKTGTAEVYNQEGELIISSLFTGFSNNQDYP
ncbi:MAG: hypothetical protein GX034_02455, partial [Clostridiaceae bacterium]|nr:hypothetical protein [Clostridiaceae bacterium]